MAAASSGLVRRAGAAVVCVLVLAASLVACTPRPASARPVARDFLEAVASADWDKVSSLIDAPDRAVPIWKDTFAGLQAESLTIDDPDVEVSGNSATARYHMTWALPRDRTLSYDTSVLLTLQDETWTVRWQPSSVHPRLGANQHLELRAVTPTRASVVSSDGVALLTPGTVHRVVVQAGQANPQVAARRIADALAHAHAQEPSVATVNPRDLEHTLRGASGAYSVATVPAAVGEMVRADLTGLDGVSVNDEATMLTPKPGFAPDIMARLRGVVDSELDGAAGWRVSVVNPEGVALADVDFHDAQPAPRVDVSIDYQVQQAAQEAVDTRRDDEAMMVALRPSTGQILAVAQTAAADRQGDLALSGQYPPGSVFKIITAAAAMQDEQVGPDTPVPCPGRMNLFGRTVVNYNEFSLGTVPLEQAFARSCNTSFAQLSTDLRPGRLKEVASQFGIGADFDIAGIDTLTGSVPQADSELDRTEAGYGQGLDLVSPFGMALAAATAATGQVPTPQLVASKPTHAKGVGPRLPESLTAGLHRMMRSVVTTGTAQALKAEGEVYGKTGEAEFNEGSHAWFVGFRPANPDGEPGTDLAFATLVVKGGGSEAAVAMTDHFFARLDGAA